VTKLEGHIKLLQEVRALRAQFPALEARMGKAGHAITFGKPCEAAARNIKEHAGLKEHTTVRAGAARHGGVAIAARLPQTLVTRDLI
jgi:hypothetical protein